MVGALRWLFYRAISGGNGWLRDYEAQAIYALYEALSSSEKERFSKQLQLLDLVQRSPNGKISQVFQMIDSTRKNWGEDIKLPLLGKEERAFKVSLYHDEKLYLRGVLYITYGAFSSMEFDTIPKTFSEKSILISNLHEVIDNFESASRPIILKRSCEEISSDEAEQLEKSLLNDVDQL